MRFFNTAGACEPDRHYMIPAAERLPEARDLIAQGGYFVVHAPRQTGKTTTLRALIRELAREPDYAAVYFSCKVAEAAGDRPGPAQEALLDELRRGAASLPVELQPPRPWPAAAEFTLLRAALSAWAERCPRPLVLVFDEIDTLYGASLRAVLAQLHAGYPERPRGAPWSVILCGLRDVRDYREAAGKDPERFGSASPFNIKLKSVRLSDFTTEEIGDLYAQHTADTGQPFTPQAVQRVLELTRGQPWLVNAIAREITIEMRVAPPAPIEVEHVEQAKERLILARAAHLDSLAARLAEARVQRVIEPVIAGAPRVSSRYEDDVEYARDLGLLSLGRAIEIANPIYKEVIVRVLAGGVQRDIPADPRSFVLPDGRLDFGRILREFAAFFKEHGEVLEGDLNYHEVAPQLVLMAYLQRVVNGGGHVAREYGLGRGRIDLLLRWPYQEGGKRAWQREAIELKVWRDKQADPLPEGLKQLDEYLARLELPHGALVIFDRRSNRRAQGQRGRFLSRRTASGRAVTVLRA
jgi:hypothetical protein